jgi:ABC-type sulfate/molybdate transport systems ATPase subunit
MGSISELCDKSILMSDGKINEIGPSPHIIEKYLQSNISYTNRVMNTDIVDRNFVGPYEIRSVWLENSNGQETYLFRHYDDIVFSMRITSQANPVVVGVSVKDLYNQPLIFLSNINDRTLLETDYEESVVRVKFSRNLLRGGEYLVTFSLNTGNNMHCDLWRNVIKFQINDTDLGYYLALSPVKSEGVWSISNK